MNTQTNSENGGVEIPSLPSLLLHLYPSNTLHESHITPKRRFLSPSHRSFQSPLKTNSFTQSRFDFQIPFPFPPIPFSFPHPLSPPSLPHLLFDFQQSNQIQSHLSSLPPLPHPLTPPYTHQHNRLQSNPSITLKVSSPSPHLHHPPSNPCFQPQINALPPWFPRLPPFVNSQLRTANPGVISLLDEFLF